MEISTWHIWTIIAILLLIVELFAPTFLAASLAIGCIVSAITSGLDFGIKIQLLSFSIGTLISFFGVRPFMLKYAYKNGDKIKTNVDALIGKVGRVTETVDGSKNEGRVMIEGDDWKAETENEKIISVGEKIEVLKINSTVLTVKPINKED